MRTRRVGTVLVGAAALAASLATAPAANAVREPGQTPEQRAAALVAQLTPDEKITQLHGIRDADHQRFVPGVPRLGIPPLRITNGPAGVGPSDDPHQQPATALPAPISLAATFDPLLAAAYGDVQGAETRDLAHGLIEAPDINLTRVPENGRTFETYGEDPLLAGRLAAADIRAIQRHGIIAEVKHFAANNQETNRFAVNELIDERTLEEIYLPAFEMSVRQGRAGSVMCAYPKVNGLFACENPFLLDTVLRGQWGFDGFVQSDFGATHSTVPSALAGEDLEMPTGQFFDSAMRDALASGQIDESVIDRMIARRYAVMIRLGLFDHPPAPAPIPADRDGAVARRIAEAGTVLLKNSADRLPLDPAATRRVAVIGPFAGAARTGGGGSSHVLPLHTVDPVTGIENRLGPGADVAFADGSDVTAAAGVARSADVAVVMVGDDETEGRDRPGLALSGNQDQLVAAVAAANPNTVVVVKSGAPVLMPWLDQVPAVVEAWYPGEEDGNAVAAVLFGDVNPSGKLPVTFPHADADTPAHTPDRWPGVNGTATYAEGLRIGYRWYDAQGIAPLFPFGYGLSYTTFGYGHLTVRPAATRAGEISVGLDVTNTGRRAGADVAQVYLGSPAAAGEPPRRLVGFQKVFLRPGQTRHLTFTLDRRAFSVWDTASHAWTIVPGRHQVWAGDSSRDLPLSAAVDVRGSARRAPRKHQVEALS
ncbi:MAG TPA: glycoside hydrolase family 3 C-terminal domain-containing protein [Streptosporangiaceae bacterium]